MRYFSNEIVFRGHPDKVCDQIGAAVLAECVRQDKNTRAGIEVTGGKGKIFVTGEVTTKAKFNVKKIVKRVLSDVGYKTNYKIIDNLGKQSPDIAQGVDIGGAGDQGCIAKGSLITTKNGFKKIEDVKIGDMVLTRFGFKRVLNAKYTGIKNTIAIKTNMGSVLNLTEDHLVLANNKWTEARDILNHTVNLPSISKFNPTKYSYHMEPSSDWHGGKLNGRGQTIVLNEELAYLMGVLIGDGVLTSEKYITFAFRQEDKVEATLPIIQRVFKDATIKVRKDGIIVNGVLYRKALYSMGLDYWHSNAKRVPICILENSIDIQAAFLRGLMDTDGTFVTCRTKGRQKDSCKISVASVSYMLMHDVRLMFKNMGIDCLLTKNGIGVSKIAKGNYMSYRLNIRGATSVFNYAKKIGFLVKYKKDKMDSFIKNYNGTRNPSSTETVIKLYDGGMCEVYDLEIEDCHEFYANGILVHNCMFGYACDDTNKMLPKAMVILQEFAKLYDEIRKNDNRLLPDGKAQITGVYDDDFNLIRIRDFTVSYQNTEEEREDTDSIIENLAREICEKYGIMEIERFLINPTGKFLIGGFEGDAGVCGRKIVIDAYQGFANVGGGNMNAKDATKVDFSASHMARKIACEYLNSHNLKWCEVQLSYAIGIAEPLAIYINSNIGYIEPEKSLYQRCTPANIIKELNLLEADYEELAKFGHYTKADD